MNITKKLFLTSLFLAFFQFNLHAKTQGHYFGPSINYTNKKYITNDARSIHNETGGTKIVRSGDVNLGVEYSYAININRFFLMPKIFYDNHDLEYRSNYSITELFTSMSGNENKRTNTYNASNYLMHSYGYGINIGYDLDSKYSIYLIFGNKKSKNISIYDKYTITNIATSRVIVSSKSYIDSLIYGIGAKYQVNDFALMLNIEPSTIRKIKSKKYYSNKNDIFEENKNKRVVTGGGKTTLFKLNISYNF